MIESAPIIYGITVLAFIVMLIAKPAWADAITRVVNVITRPVRWIVGPLVRLAWWGLLLGILWLLISWLGLVPILLIAIILLLAVIIWVLVMRLHPARR
jgi:hypothetical protein